MDPSVATQVYAAQCRALFIIQNSVSHWIHCGSYTCLYVR